MKEIHTILRCPVGHSMGGEGNSRRSLSGNKDPTPKILSQWLKTEAKHKYIIIRETCVVHLLTFPGQASASSIFFLKLSLNCSMRLWWAEIIISLKHIQLVIRQIKIIQKKRLSNLKLTLYSKTYLSSFRAATSSLALMEDSFKAYTYKNGRK